MTKEEIIKVAKIMLTADNWCSTCSTSLITNLSAAFPEHFDVIFDIQNRATEIEMKLYIAIDKWDYDLTKPEPNVWDVDI